MPTECSADLFEFARCRRPRGGGRVRRRDDHLGCRRPAARRDRPGHRPHPPVRRLLSPTTARRTSSSTSVETLVGQRVFALGAGLRGPQRPRRPLRHDPVLATVVGKLSARRADCAPLAGKSTLNRLEHAPAGDADALQEDRPRRAPRSSGSSSTSSSRPIARRPAEIVLDLDATDDPIHGHQEGRFFHGYYDATATCRCTSSAATTCWWPSCGRRTSTPAPGRWRSSRGSWRRSASAGRR